MAHQILNNSFCALRQSWDSNETVMRQSWDSHETIMWQSTNLLQLQTLQTCLFLSVLWMYQSPPEWVAPLPWPSAYGEGHSKNPAYSRPLNMLTSADISTDTKIVQKVKSYIHIFFFTYYFFYWGGGGVEGGANPQEPKQKFKRQKLPDTYKTGLERPP